MSATLEVGWHSIHLVFPLIFPHLAVAVIDRSLFAVFLPGFFLYCAPLAHRDNYAVSWLSGAVARHIFLNLMLRVFDGILYPAHTYLPVLPGPFLCLPS